jgi:hypothetical protein
MAPLSRNGLRDLWRVALRTSVLAVGTLALLALLGLSADARQEGDDEGKPKIVVAYTPFMQFGLMVIDGAERKQITCFPDGRTNTTVLRIDGKDVVFGHADGKLGNEPDVKKGQLGKDAKGKNRLGSKSTWVYNKIHVTQIVEIVPSKKGALDAVLVTYEIENKDDEAHTVGIRTVIDTLIVKNDGNPFAVPGKNEAITTSADFRGKQVPAYAKALERGDLDNPGFVAHFTFKVGGKVEAPDRVSFTHWPGQNSGNYDVAVDDIDGDAAVAMYWSPRELPNGGRRTVAFAYGHSIVGAGK